VPAFRVYLLWTLADRSVVPCVPDHNTTINGWKHRLHLGVPVQFHTFRFQGRSTDPFQFSSTFHLQNFQTHDKQETSKRPRCFGSMKRPALPTTARPHLAHLPFLERLASQAVPVLVRYVHKWIVVHRRHQILLQTPWELRAPHVCSQFRWIAFGKTRLWLLDTR
jgi:hypothetical protein